MHVDCARSGPGSRGSSHSEHPELEKASVDASVQPTNEATSAAVGVGCSAEGMLQLEHERRAAGGAGPDLRPTCGARGTRWSRSGSAPGASARMSSSTQTQTGPVRR